MPLIFEDSPKVGKRKIPITKKQQEYFGTLYNALEPHMGKNNLKNLKNLATNKVYNKKGETSIKNGNEENVNSVSSEEARKRMERFPKDPLHQLAQGGQIAYNLYKNGLEKSRRQEKVPKVQPPKPTSNASLKTEPPKVKQIEVPNGTITYNENKIIKENFDCESKFFEYYEEYNTTYVLEEFFKNPKGKQDWGVLINPNMYAKALREFTRDGELHYFPSKYIYQWMGIILKNTAILYANTNLAGHSTYFPSEDFEDFLITHFGENRDITVKGHGETYIQIFPKEIKKIYNKKNPLLENIAVDKQGQTYFPWITQNDVNRYDIQKNLTPYLEMINQYNNDKNNQFRGNKIEINYTNGKIYWVIEALDLLDEMGLYDWMMMPDGSDAWSDYGLEPLYKILSKYEENSTPEDTLVLINKALDVYHQRGDMASIFIQGGSKSLSQISETIKKKKGKKIYLKESTLQRIYKKL